MAIAVDLRRARTAMWLNARPSVTLTVTSVTALAIDDATS
jgi:hypothetical protein